MSNTIERRQINEKEALLEVLEGIPNISLACKLVGISRATYYRWMGEDEKFRNSVRQAEREGTENINNILEARLIEMAQDGDLPAIMYWLKHHKWNYMDEKELKKQENVMTYGSIVE